MDMTHELVTNEIKDEIRKYAKTKSRNPGYELVEYENDPPTLLRYGQGIVPNMGGKRALRFCGYELKEDQVEEYLYWFSGVVFGFLVGTKKYENK